MFVQVLGMCPTLAVTNSVRNALAMGLATIFVLVACRTLLISLLRNVIPSEVRIASYILIIATFVTVVDYAIQAISLELHKALGAFIALIVVNCIILGRAEAFASQQRRRCAPSSTALGMGLGFSLALLLPRRGARECWATAPCFGDRLFGRDFEPWVDHDAAARRLLHPRRLAAGACNWWRSAGSRAPGARWLAGASAMRRTVAVDSIFLNACLINNFVLAYFLGICPFLGVSGGSTPRRRMGAAVTLRDAGHFALRLRRSTRCWRRSRRPTCG